MKVKKLELVLSDSVIKSLKRRYPQIDNVEAIITMLCYAESGVQSNHESAMNLDVNGLAVCCGLRD